MQKFHIPWFFIKQSKYKQTYKITKMRIYKLCNYLSSWLACHCNLMDFITVRIGNQQEQVKIHTYTHMCATSKDVQKPQIMQEVYKASFWLFRPYYTQAILYLAKYFRSAFFRCMSFVVFVVGLQHAVTVLQVTPESTW